MFKKMKGLSTKLDMTHLIIISLSKEFFKGMSKKKKQDNDASYNDKKNKSMIRCHVCLEKRHKKGFWF